MKSYMLILSIAISLSISCKTKKATAETSSTNVKQTTMTDTQAAAPKSTGKVSHQYRATGCATVIVITTPDNTITLIPKDKLPDNIDVDGLEISFDYRLLKMHNPVGCNVGIPAAITNIKSGK